MVKTLDAAMDAAMDVPVPTYLLLVMRGMEWLVEKEIRRKLQVTYLEICSVQNDPARKNMNVMQGEAAVGRILLRTTSTPAEVMKLQSVQATLAFLVQSDAVITDRAAGLEQMAKLVTDADWEPALRLWRAHFPSADAAPKKPAFRGSCVRDGRHAYRSMEVAGEIGSAVIDKFGWDVNLVAFDLEIVCILYHNFMITGISLADTSKIKFCSRLANEDRKGVTADVKYISTLRPSTTYLMFQLAEYKVGEIFLDSMCGVGTIPIWCAEFADNNLFALGGELDDLAVSKAGQNAATSVRNTNIMQWDATALPLRSQSIDKVIVDMPFGVRCGNHRINNKIYPKLMKELIRVLRDGGRAVILVMSKKLFLSSFQHLPFRVAQVHEVNIGGLAGGIYVLEKTSVY
uniref:Ribosomal RNA large subunit methyltransferase K/L-like methyltransferase domain-containing protein n=1 Tax=Globisporangium ultimum (strain ATCC 200006 / CBS 805.95 / DAOM BR144) TaxID=431595 RepID=K3X044_GLOUD